MHEQHLAEAISSLAGELKRLVEQRQIEFDYLKSHAGLATKHDLKVTERTIMSAISDFAAKQSAFQDRVDVAVTGLQGDIQGLNDLITKLQNSPGTVTPEDQASLDAIQARSSAIADKLDALDALTPPVVPAS